MNITHAKLISVNMPINLNKLINKIDLLQRINNIVRNIFIYLHKNQNAIRVGIWSYLILEVSVSSADLISIGNRYDLESCQNTICNFWYSHIEDRHLFPNTVEFRCNSSHSNYHPYYFLKNCMIDLCNYGKNLEINPDQCSNFKEELEGLFSTAQLWNSICPKKVFRHKDVVKEITYINNCIINLCNYINTFQIDLQQNLYSLCHNINMEKINEIFFKLSRINHKLKIELEQDNNWTKFNALMSIASSTVTSTIILLKTISTTIMHQILETSMEPLNMPFGMSGFKDIINGILQNIESLLNTHTMDQLLPQNEEVIKFFIEIQNLITELSNILSPSFSHHKYSDIVQEKIMAIDNSNLGVISSDSLLKASLQGRPITNPQLKKLLCDSEKS